MPKAQKAIYSCKSVPNENDLWKVYAVVAAPFFLGAASVPEPKSPKKHHINKTMAKTHNQQIPNPKKTMIENLNRELYDRKRWKHLLWSHSWNGEARYASISSCQFRWSFCELPWRSSYLKSLIINQRVRVTIPNINPNKIIEEGKKNKKLHFRVRAAGKAQAAQRLFWRWKLRRPHLTQRVWVLFLLLPKLPVPFPCVPFKHTCQNDESYNNI